MSTATSDFNSDTIQSKRVASLATLFTDLNLALKEHPGTKDVVPVKDIEAVKNSVKNLLRTNYGDRPFQPDVGCDITRLLFEPADEFTADALKGAIRLCLQRFEPRIANIVVMVAAHPDDNAFVCKIGFNIISVNQPQELTFSLERSR